MHLLSLIVAMDSQRTIGIDGTIPWRIPGEQALFKQYTIGHPIIMGRKTFESLPKILPGRPHIVLSSKKSDTHLLGHESVQFATSLDQAISCALSLTQDPVPEIFVIGGASLYEQALPLADRLYLSEIEGSFAGDRFFPEFDRSQFRVIKEQYFDQQPSSYWFRIYEKIKPTIS